MNDAELEAALDVCWRAFIAAVRTGKDGDAKRLWADIQRLDASRTPEQHARSLAIAELKADGTCSHPRQDKGICLKCGGVVEAAA